MCLDFHYSSHSITITRGQRQSEKRGIDDPIQHAFRQRPFLTTWELERKEIGGFGPFVVQARDECSLN